MRYFSVLALLALAGCNDSSTDPNIAIHWCECTSKPDSGSGTELTYKFNWTESAAKVYELSCNVSSAAASYSGTNELHALPMNFALCSGVISNAADPATFRGYDFEFLTSSNERPSVIYRPAGFTSNGYEYAFADSECSCR